MAKKALAPKTDSVKMDPELQGVIIGPRVTEKAAYSAEKNAYIFNVATWANKIQIARAIKTMYNVDPIKVTVSVRKPQATTFRGHRGTTKKEKKATIFLSKDQKIELA